MRCLGRAHPRMHQFIAGAPTALSEPGFRSYAAGVPPNTTCHTGELAEPCSLLRPSHLHELYYRRGLCSLYWVQGATPGGGDGQALGCCVGSEASRVSLYRCCSSLCPRACMHSEGGEERNVPSDMLRTCGYCGESAFLVCPVISFDSPRILHVGNELGTLCLDMGAQHKLYWLDGFDGTAVWYTIQQHSVRYNVFRCAKNRQSGL